jgi:hypothetical protein
MTLAPGSKKYYPYQEDPKQKKRTPDESDSETFVHMKGNGYAPLSSK